MYRLITTIFAVAVLSAPAFAEPKHAGGENHIPAKTRAEAIENTKKRLEKLNSMSDSDWEKQRAEKIENHKERVENRQEKRKERSENRQEKRKEWHNMTPEERKAARKELMDKRDARNPDVGNSEEEN